MPPPVNFNTPRETERRLVLTITEPHILRDNAKRQLDTALLSLQRRLYLLAAGQVEGAVVILRMLHEQQQAEPKEPETPQ